MRCVPGRSHGEVAGEAERMVESLSTDLSCPICRGEPEICAELDSHEWVICRACETEMRPQWTACPTCGFETDRV